MKVNVHSIHFDADQELVQFIEKKVEKLEQFYSRIISSEVYLRLDKAEDSANKIAEIKLVVPGRELFAKRQCKSFEEAADIACDAILRQVKKHKSKEAA